MAQLRLLRFLPQSKHQRPLQLDRALGGGDGLADGVLPVAGGHGTRRQGAAHLLQLRPCCHLLSK